MRRWLLPLALSLGAVPVALSLAPTPAHAGKAFDVANTNGEQLVAYLDHADWRFRLDAALELGARKLVQAEDPLTRLALQDPNERVRKACLDALERAASQRIGATAQAVALQDEVAANRLNALLTVERLSDPASAALLGQVLLQDQDPRLREKAATILRIKVWKGAEEALRKAAVEDERRQCAPRPSAPWWHWETPPTAPCSTT